MGACAAKESVEDFDDVTQKVLGCYRFTSSWRPRNLTLLADLYTGIWRNEYDVQRHAFSSNDEAGGAHFVPIVQSL